MVKHAHAQLSSSADSVSQSPCTRKESSARFFSIACNAVCKRVSRCRIFPGYASTMSGLIGLPADQPSSVQAPPKTQFVIGSPLYVVQIPIGTEQPRVKSFLHNRCHSVLVGGLNRYSCLDHQPVLAIGRLSTTRFRLESARRTVGNKPGPPKQNSVRQHTDSQHQTTHRQTTASGNIQTTNSVRQHRQPAVPTF